VNDFPARRNLMNLEDAKNEIVSANKQRAVIYAYLLEEMENALGAEKAQELFKKATFRRGRDIQAQYRTYLESGDFKGLAQHFVQSSAAGGELFRPKIEKADEKEAIVTMDACPLVAAWKEMGLDAARISTLCDAASAIDHGTFESERTSLIFSHKIGSSNSHCRLIIRGT
jgi:hypothetical protein